MANIILSAFADEYADSFEEQLAGLCRLGISHIEIRHVNKKNISKLTKDEVIEVKELLDKFSYGLLVKEDRAGGEYDAQYKGPQDGGEGGVSTGKKFG